MITQEAQSVPTSSIVFVGSWWQLPSVVTERRQFGVRSIDGGVGSVRGRPIDSRCLAQRPPAGVWRRLQFERYPDLRRNRMPKLAR
jgi:hypothetical protein